MKAYILGDLQAHAWSEESITPNGINARLMDLIRELRRIRKQAIENSVKYVFILGDVFEERGKLDTIVQNSIYREAYKYRKAGIRLILLVGNHDKVPVGDFHSLEVFQDLVTVVAKPAKFDFSGVRVLAIPFMAEPRKVVKVLDKFGKDADIILMHTSVLKVKINEGAKWTEGIPLSAIPKKPFTLIGHDHKRKKIRKRVWHVGSLLHVDKGDEGRTKYFAEYKDGKLEWHPTHGPEFRTIPLSDELFDKVKEKKLKRRKLQGVIEGHFIDVTYTGKLERIGEIKSKLLKWGARSVTVSPVIKQTDEPTIQEKASVRLDKMLTRYVKQLPISDQESALSIGRDILKEAMSEA